MSIYTTCDATFAAFKTSKGVDFGALRYDPGTLAGVPKALPDRFLIYRVVADPDISHYNNVPARRAYTIQVNLYLKTKADLDTYPGYLDTALIAAGFRPQGNGRDTDQLDTGHWGWSKNYQK